VSVSSVRTIVIFHSNDRSKPKVLLISKNAITNFALKATGDLKMFIELTVLHDK